MHLCDLFYFFEDLDIASYADDTTIYTVKENKEFVINTLEDRHCHFSYGSITTLAKLTVTRVTFFFKL